MALDEELISRSNRNNEEAEYAENEDNLSRVGMFNAQKLADAKRQKDLLENKAPVSSGLRIVDKRLLAIRRGQQKGASTESSLGQGNPATSKLLQAAWKNIIPTWGLSIIWIDIHIFLSQVLGKDLFCSLGQEWFPKGTPRNLHGAKKSVGMTEGMAVGCLNVGFIFLIIGILSIIAMIVNGIENPLDFLKEYLGNLWRALVGGDK